jgi:ElaB/YqjD/DUF883 family membrane-anchored ribosome-binding protein
MRKVSAKFDQLQADMDTLRKDAKQLASGLGEVADSAVNAAGEAYNGAGKWTNGNIGSVRESVRDQPLTAVLVSLGAGALLGALFLRR